MHMARMLAAGLEMARMLEPEPEPEQEPDTSDREDDGGETLEELQARLAVPLLPMLAPVPVAPSGPRAKRRTTGFIKTNKVAERSLQALSLPDIAEPRAGAPLQNPGHRRRKTGGAQTERAKRTQPPPAAALSPHAAATESVAANRPHTDRTGSPQHFNARVAELEERGFTLLARRVEEDLAAADAAEGEEKMEMNKSMSDFFGATLASSV